MKFKYYVSGMTCAACSARVEKVTRQVDGVIAADVNLLAGTMVVDSENDLTESISKAVEDAGYRLSLFGGAAKTTGQKESNPFKGMQVRLIGSAVCLVILMYFTMGHMAGLPVPTWYHGRENALVSAMLQFFLTLPVVFLNRVYYSRGLKALWHRSPNMDSLIAVGSMAALIYGIAALFRMAWAIGHGAWDIVNAYKENLYFESAAMILTLITLGKYLEERAKGKTGDAIRALMDLTPKTAAIKKDDLILDVPAESVQVGDIVVIRSGDRIPVDGVVVCGRASVDQSALTGESIPVEKKPGDAVAAATISREGYLEFRAEKVGEDTTLAQVIRLVEDAGGSKAPISRLADRVAGVFVPVVMTIAIITFGIWMILGYGLEFSLTNAISVLVISCPCALGLATPVAIMVGTGRGAQMGVLFKNAQALENLHRADTVVLDKTGTLTFGNPEVTDIIPAGMEKKQLLLLAAALEQNSEHAFAKAILHAADSEILPAAVDFQTLPGRGVSAIIEGTRYYGGNARLMREQAITIPEQNRFFADGKTPLYFGDEKGRFLGMIAAADILKPDSSAAVKAMQELGLDVVMLTGDNKETAGYIAGQAGIRHIISDVLPADKAGAIQSLQKDGHHVLMVGDGINDAPALVTANVGMAIGSGTDIAMESADIVLMKSSLGGVTQAIELSKATIRNIRQNLFWAFFYNSLGIPVAAGLLFLPFGIRLSPMLGAAAMSMSSVFVVTNALRLRRFRPKTMSSVSAPEIEKKTDQIIKEEMQMETVIKVEGMMCNHCKARVEKVCKAVPGTDDAVVDLQAKTVTVTGTADLQALKRAIEDADYQVVD